ncbi:MAG: hypothetical protein AYK23_03305 [Candidatus Proteinoplasmatales archaeon SG8-5]|nr:MAG: hypothetical protein AYK23_03305 [Candidatus Proteinoplasmatales archaeon SG8-5]
MTFALSKRPSKALPPVTPIVVVVAPIFRKYDDAEVTTELTSIGPIEVQDEVTLACCDHTILLGFPGPVSIAAKKVVFSRL